MYGARIAASTTEMTMRMPMMAAGLPRKRRRARAKFDSSPIGRRVSVAALIRSAPSDPQARIDEADQQVDDQVGDDEEQSRDQHHGHDGVEVLAEDGAHAVARDAGPGEDHLDDEGIADERRKFQAEDGERR